MEFTKHRLYLVTLALVVALLAGCATVGAPERLTDGSTYVIEMPGERDGYRRSYRLHVPEGYRETETVPLVVVVHGAFSTSAEFEQHTGFSELADREGFIVAYPDGIGILGFLQHWIPHYKSVHRGYLTVAIGCTGGQHRSVYMTEKLAAALREFHSPVLTRHNELGGHLLSKT